MKPVQQRTAQTGLYITRENSPGTAGRRQFLKALGGLSLAGALPRLTHASGNAVTKSGPPDLEVELRAAPDAVSIWPGQPTQVWRFHAKVLNGNPHAVEHLPGSYSGPIIRVKRGQTVRIHFANELPQPSIVHWHGLIIPEIMDGHPRFSVPPGGRYEYEFRVNNRAGTYWFHPHPHGLTGPQVYAGLAGLFIVSDNEESALGLPSGEQDIALIIQDRSFTADNQLRYLNSGGGMMGMMGGMTGFTGDHILVNGRPGYELPVERRAYRLRLLNGSNSRIYKLAWQDGTPMTVIGSDGGLLAAPVHKPYVTLAPAERVELWVDFSNRMPGDRPVLYSLPFSAGQGGPMMGRMGSGALANGSAFPVLSVRVGSAARIASSLPDRLTGIPALEPEQAVNYKQPRLIQTTASGMSWSLNGRQFQMRSFVWVRSKHGNS
jgi:FtsP/CotA-like multicopper oxidase with cupredoxin domain